MLPLLYSGQYAVAILLIICLIISLTFHEYGHALAAKLFGDDTAQKLGRLSLNPIVHIDPMGLLMVVLVGFGYAKPVPTNPNNFSRSWGMPVVAIAGPVMNLILAFITINIYVLGANSGNTWFLEEGPRTFFQTLAGINVLLMLFNLIPIGPLDGHYILGHLLPSNLSRIYLEYNRRYGHYLFLGIILLSIAKVPFFSNLFDKLWVVGFAVLEKLIVV